MQNHRETITSGDFLRGPEALRHPYSKALSERAAPKRFQPVPAFSPMPRRFRGRRYCPWRTEECGGETPMRAARMVRGVFMRLEAKT